MRGKRTTLRLPVEEDLAAHQRWAADPRLRRAGPVGRWHEPAMSATWKERFVEQAKDKGSVLWSIDAGDALIGYARLGLEESPPADIVQLLQLVIDPGQQYLGLGWDAGLALHRWIFDFMHLRMASVDHIAADDAGRRRILEKLGYQQFGHAHSIYYRSGAYIDGYLYQMEIDAWDARWGAEREYAPLGPESER